MIIIPEKESRSPAEDQETANTSRTIVFYYELITALEFLNEHRYLLEEHVRDCMLSDFVSETLRVKAGYDQSHTK